MSNAEASAHGQFKFDPESGLFCLLVGVGDQRRWSQPMELAQVARVLKQEYERRLRDGQQVMFNAEQIDVQVLLSSGIFTPPVRKVDASDPRIKAAAAKKVHDEVRFMDADELLGKLGF